MVFAIFASWLAPALQAVPVLSIFAPPGSPKNLVMQILNMVCRRPLCVVGLTRGDMLSLPMELQPALLLDEPDSASRTQAILRASSRQGIHIAAKREIVEMFGPKIILSSKPMNSGSGEGDELRVTLIPISGAVPLLDKRLEEEIAGEFQSRLLGYPLRNFSHVRVPSFDVSRLAVPVQVLAQTLGSAVVGDDKLQARILPIVADLDEEARAGRASSIDSITLEAFLFFIHQGGWSKVRTQEVAEKVAAIYKGRECDSKGLSAESIGWTIRRLSIPRGRIDRAGNGVELTVSVCRLIHTLAVAYGVRALQFGFREGCRYCQELESTAKQDRTSEAITLPLQ